MSFFSSKNKSTYKLSVSLKSSSIDIQLIEINSNNKRSVLFLEQKVIFLENSQDPQLYTNQYTKELSQIFKINRDKIKSILKNNHVDVDFVLHSPWFTSSISVIEHKERAELNESFISKKLATFKAESNLFFLEKRIIKIQANGYDVEKINDLVCENINIYVYSSYISKNIQELLSKVIKENISKINKISYVTSPILFLDNIKRFLIKEDNVVFIYVDSEITQVGIIESDSLVYFSTFPIGKHDFLREIKFNIETYDYDLLYQKEIKLKSPKQQESFDSLKNKWSNSVKESLKLFQKNVPNKLLIISDQKTAKFFYDNLSISIKDSSDNILKNSRIINFDLSLFKDIIEYKTQTGDNELDLKLEALI